MGCQTCAHCGSRIDLDDAIHDEDTGDYYCDSECAEFHDCYWCENVWEYHSENVYYDDFLNEYFYDEDDERIETEDYQVFRNKDVAIAAGYVYKEGIGWISEDSCEEENEIA